MSTCSWEAILNHHANEIFNFSSFNFFSEQDLYNLTEVYIFDSTLDNGREYDFNSGQFL